MPCPFPSSPPHRTPPRVDTPSTTNDELRNASTSWMHSASGRLGCPPNGSVGFLRAAFSPWFEGKPKGKPSCLDPNYTRCALPGQVAIQEWTGSGVVGPIDVVGRSCARSREARAWRCVLRQYVIDGSSRQPKQSYGDQRTRQS